jgi:glyceraldehyde-3-phosphate dehydrogenase/erythrose-4-phosphate dehydrogenase
MMQVNYEGMHVDIVLECTGEHLTHATLAPYFAKGVKKVSRATEAQRFQKRVYWGRPCLLMQAGLAVQYSVP